MTPIALFGSATLCKKKTDMSVYYALRENDEIIAYYWLMTVRQYQNVYKGHEFHVATQQQGKGIGTFLYKHIILEDKYTVMSDHYHTSGSSAMWDKLQKMTEFQVGTYNENLDSFDWINPVDKQKVYNNDYMHFVVRARP